MTEDDARAWMTERFGAAATERVATFLARVEMENRSQNLIAPSSIPHIWARHAVDSAQLLTLVGEWSSWLDIGTGGGFPGMVVALLMPGRRVVMVEPRAKRAAFLADCAARYGLAQATIEQRKVQSVHCIADVISARAVAPAENILRDALHCANAGTMWLLPRGRSYNDSEARRMFHVEHSVTDPASVILTFKGRPS